MAWQMIQLLTGWLEEDQKIMADREKLVEVKAMDLKTLCKR